MLTKGVSLHRDGNAARAEGDAKLEEARDGTAQVAQVLPFRMDSSVAKYLHPLLHSCIQNMTCVAHQVYLL